MRALLENPLVYQAFQVSGGFFGARLVALRKHVRFRGDERIVDVGCGPGYLRRYLPESCQYLGFDTDERYIRHALASGQKNAEYRLSEFNAASAREVAPVDVVMMCGLLHHLTDEQAKDLLLAAGSALAPNGRLMTLDGCYYAGQSTLRRKMLDWDRGRYVRTEPQYRALFPASMTVQSYVDDTMSWFPYSWVTCVSTLSGNAAA